jgi:hypothetical protein
MIYRFVPRGIAPPTYRRTMPQWLRALSDPPPVFYDDDEAYELIAHIRNTGQVGSGEIREIDSCYGRPWASATEAAPVSKDASTRIDAEIRAAMAAEEARTEAQAKIRREQFAKELVRLRRQAAKRKAERDERERRRREHERAQWEAQREYERLQLERQREQARRDREWTEATAKADAEQAAKILAAQRKRQAEDMVHQQRAPDPRIVAKLAHEHRKADILRALERLRAQGMRDVRVGDLMRVIDCSDEAEIYRCVQELGLAWRPG